MRVSEKQVFIFTNNLIYLMEGREFLYNPTVELSQKALSLKLGVGQTTISGWLCGKTFPRKSTLHTLADFFGVSVDELLNVDLKSFDIRQLGQTEGWEFPADMEEQAPYKEALELRRQYNELSEKYNIVKPLAEHYLQLNASGKKKVVDYARDLADNTKYRKE